MLDAKIASDLQMFITNPYFKKKVGLEMQNAHMEDRCLRGRQIAFVIYEYFRVPGAHDAVLNFQLCSVSLYMATIFTIFDTRWDRVLLSAMKFPTRFWKVCTRCECEGLTKLQTVVAMNEQQINQDRSKPGYQLKTMVRRHIDQKIRTRIFQARNEKN